MADVVAVSVACVDCSFLLADVGAGMSTALPNPWIPNPPTFVLDIDAFLEAIEPAPKFISAPSPEYMSALDLAPIVEILTKF